jgi:hypothetical protein
VTPIQQKNRLRHCWMTWVRQAGVETAKVTTVLNDKKTE